MERMKRRWNAWLNGKSEAYAVVEATILFPIIVTEYLSEDGSRWGLLLDEKLETLAELPQLCDLLPDGFLFDDQLGNLRQCRVYSIEALKNLANQVLEESQRGNDQKELWRCY